jgi:hypothetical protein
VAHVRLGEERRHGMHSLRHMLATRQYRRRRRPSGSKGKARSRQHRDHRDISPHPRRNRRHRPHRTRHHPSEEPHLTRRRTDHPSTLGPSTANADASLRPPRTRSTDAAILWIARLSVTGLVGPT